MKINKMILLLLISFTLSSCVVSTAAKIVTTTAKIGISAVKGTVKGVGWAVKKAEGKIDEDRLNGTWKVVGIYNGTYEQFTQDSDPANNFKSECAEGVEVIEFKSKKGKFQPIHCQSEKEDWVKYKFEFGKNPQTKNKENYLKYNSSNYISIIDVTSKTMVLEGNLLQTYAFSGGKLYLFEKMK
ncbi:MULTISPECIES: hypothetical protein [unclassified Kaistella]|uniref:hypothetical protein n=1 Tax=unclassified Kaistella TaxID=2762626 RepID=UPI0027352888|nr:MULTISPECIES: hypothetical protein [unclassified Kaistella]MDP2455065.1 hypothetical protein [Kaistella sp. SH11-4b]MDP2457973.1 hypothetical protein [Kaistella sp. SH40-3]MDP2460883.1 hypothetical protein [Kaistella sp. SH19-2b]